MENQKIAAVIVTFNRSEKLDCCLSKILEQSNALSSIFIIDNASTDDTSDVIAKYAQQYSHIIPIHLKENLGGAGGFYTGIKEAYSQGADYIWVMDDDCYPNADALEKLIEAYNFFDESQLEPPAFAASHVLWKDGTFSNLNPLSPRNDWSKYYSPDHPYALLKAASFVSVLIPRISVKTYGLPIKEYFIWFDDIEYTQRLSKRGSHYGVGVMDSVVIHDSQENIIPDYTHINDQNIWKYAYNIRNNAAYRLHQRGKFLSFISYGFKLKRQLKKSNISNEYKKRLTKAYWGATKFKPKIEYISDEF